MSSSGGHNFVASHDLQRSQNGGMVPRFPAKGSASIEQLLGCGGARQGQPKRSRPFQREIEILLMQLNAKTWIKIALQHALAVHFKDPGRRKAAHQRLAHQRRIGAGLGSK